MVWKVYGGGGSSARVELWKSTTAPVPLVLPEFLWSSYNGSPRSQFHPAGLRAAPPPGWVLLWKSLYYCTNCSRHHPDNMPAARLKLIWLHWSLICWWKFQFWSIALETILSQVFDMDKLLSSPTWQHAGCSVDTSLSRGGEHISDCAGTWFCWWKFQFWSILVETILS